MSALAVLTRPTEQEATDSDLVAGVRAGDDRAFELLFVRYQPRIAAYVGGMVHDHGRAEDITQEIFISALRRLRQTDGAIAFKPWIYEIAKNACIDVFRRSRGKDEISFDAQDALGAGDVVRLAEPGATPDSVVEGKVAFDNLCGAFGGLSQTHHEILVMREFDGLSYREIGERLGMSRPAVESTLFRARRRLGEEYEELVSGERCLRVQRIVDADGGSAAGLRDQRRLARHLAHCQPCRRYAGLAGVNVDAVAKRPRAAKLAAARIAAILPLPLFWRRRSGVEEASQLLGPPGVAPVAQWSASVAGVVDPALVAGWTKAVATAAAVAVAGIGAGAAMTERDALEGFIARVPAVMAGSESGQGERRGLRPSDLPSLTRAPAAGLRAGAGAGVGALADGVDHAAGMGALANGVNRGSGSRRADGARRSGDASSGSVPSGPAALPGRRGAASSTTVTGVTDKLDVRMPPAPHSAGDAGASRGGAAVTGTRAPQRAVQRLIDTLRSSTGTRAGGAQPAPVKDEASAQQGIPAALLAPAEAGTAAAEPVTATSTSVAPTSPALADTVSGVTAALTTTLSAAQPPS